LFTMLRAVVLALAMTTATAARPTWRELDGYTFKEYLMDFHKHYTPGPELERHRRVFEANLATIRAHNADTSRTWRAGVNQFTDLDKQDMEFYKGIDKNIMHGRRAKANTAAPRATLPGDLPISVDWRDQGVVTSVKSQGHCGSCWTFAATEALESVVAISTGKLFTFSEQEFVSCVENTEQCGGTGGCSGATMELAYDYAIENGLATEWTYPYTSYYGEDGNCTMDSIDPPVAGITGYTVNPTNSYKDLITSVATVAPVAVTVDASVWHLYESGIFDGCNQETPDLDHGVLLVGYGTEDGTGYYLIRNSWGPAWGESGYIRIQRTADEASLCGVDVTPADGVGCEGGPENVTVCGTCGILYDTSYPTGGYLV